MGEKTFNNSAKLIDKNEYPFGTLYTYDNGLKIIYKKVPYVKNKMAKTKFKFAFLGGSSQQGKYQGLAHFAEHCMFIDELFHKTFEDAKGCTSYKKTEFEMSINHKKIDEMLKKFDDLSENELKILVNKVVRQDVKNTLDIFAYEVNSKFWESNAPVTQQFFEEEKQIIDEEYLHAYEDKDKTLRCKFIHKENANGSRITNCGDNNTLKLVTIDDVIDFKEKNYVINNLIVKIDAPVEYSFIERTIVNELSNNIKSNLEASIPLDSVIDYPAKQQKFNIDFQNQPEKKKVEIITFFDLQTPTKENISEDLIVHFLMNTLFMKHKPSNAVRRLDRMVYSIKKNTFLDDNMNEFTFETDMNKENLAKTLYSQTKYIRNCILYEFNEEFYYFIKQNLYEKNKKNEKSAFVKRFDTLLNVDNLSCIFSLKFSNKEIKKAEKILMQMSYEDVCKLLKKYLDNSKINYLLKGYVKEEDLPSFDFLCDTLHNQMKDLSMYPKTMKEDIKKYSKIDDLNKNPADVKSLIVIER